MYVCNVCNRLPTGLRVHLCVYTCIYKLIFIGQGYLYYCIVCTYIQLHLLFTHAVVQYCSIANESLALKTGWVSVEYDTRKVTCKLAPLSMLMDEWCGKKSTQC